VASNITATQKRAAKAEVNNGQQMLMMVVICAKLRLGVVRGC
jgi:hypothetical protein